MYSEMESQFRLMSPLFALLYMVKWEVYSGCPHYFLIMYDEMESLFGIMSPLFA